MASITLHPPSGQGIYRQFRLTSGKVLRPDFSRGGQVMVHTDAEARELENEGWCRIPTTAKRAPQIAAIEADRRHYREQLSKSRELLDTLRNLRDRLARQAHCYVFAQGAPVNGAMHAGVAGVDLSALLAAAREQQAAESAARRDAELFRKLTTELYL